MTDDMLGAIARLWVDGAAVATRMVAEGAFDTEREALEWAHTMRQACDNADMFAYLMADDERQHEEF